MPETMTAQSLAKQLLETYILGEEDHSDGLAALSGIPPLKLFKERCFLRLFLIDLFTWEFMRHDRAEVREKLLNELHEQMRAVEELDASREAIFRRDTGYLHAVHNPHPTLGEPWEIGKVFIDLCEPCVWTNTELLVAAEYAFANTLLSDVCQSIEIT